VLLYGPGDAHTQARLRGPTPWPGAVEGWEALQSYVFGTTCRSVALAARFGDVVRPCGTCDVCVDPGAVSGSVNSRRAEIRATVAARDARRRADDAVLLTPAQVEAVVSFVGGLRRPAGRTVVAAALRGGRTKRVRRLRLQDNPGFGTLRGTPDRAILRSIDALLADGRLAAKGKKYPTLWLPGKPVRAPAGSRPPKE
jgi:superfamily II DNA helicase RecQ